MELEHQQRLFRLAPEAVCINASWRSGQGWALAVRVRRGDESWDEAHSEDYEQLTTEELVDVLVADLEAALGL